MVKHKIFTVIGARPQFIKASVVSAALAQSRSLTEVLVHTGQHFDSNMSDIFFHDLGMRCPDHTCGIHGGNHGDMTGRMLTEIERLLLSEQPAAVLVYGDTNSTLAGALAAVKLGIPVAHVEAGLRSFNLSMPEEINRVLTDRISRWLFAPTEAAVSHLRHEGVNSSSIYQVGDVMFDVARRHGETVRPDDGLLATLAMQYGVQAGHFCLATVHRAESTNHIARLTTIIEALIAFAREMPVIFPLHPRTRQVLQSLGMLDRLSRQAIVTAPLGYLDMLQLEKYAALIATDSGGVQKEAFFYGVPCVTLRDETEWRELVDAGWNTLAPLTDARALLTSLRARVGSTGTTIAPYGNGNTAQAIVSYLEDALA